MKLIEKILKDYKYSNSYKKKNIFENYLKHNLFFSSINEKQSAPVINKSRDEVISLINANNLETTPQEFYNSLIKSHHAKMLTPYSISELSKFKLFKVPGYNIGYALKNENGLVDIIAVHNNEPSIKGIGEILMRSAINNGGNALDHFDSDKLTSLYSKMGFKEYQRFPYDSQYDEDGSFANKYGKLDVVYRKL